jgi:hypothetical protein
VAVAAIRVVAGRPTRTERDAALGDQRGMVSASDSLSDSQRAARATARGDQAARAT